MAVKVLQKLLRNTESLTYKVFKVEVDAINNNLIHTQVIKRRHWATSMKCLMESLGFAETWLNQLDNIPNFNIIRTRIRDQFLQHWCNHINSTPKLEYYSMFKTSFCFEIYPGCIKASLTFKCMTEHLFADFSYSIALDTYL